MASLHRLAKLGFGLVSCVVLAGCAGSAGGPPPPPSPYLVVFGRNLGPSPAGEEIWVMDGNGGTMTQLTSNGAGDGNPTVSQNSVVIFDSARSGKSKIYGMELDGSDQTALSQDDSISPRINAAGMEIVYTHFGAAGGEIWKMDSDGSNQVQLTFDGADAENPTFTPDGQHIIFQRMTNGNYQIYSMDVDGSNVVRLTNNSTDDEKPAVSPDGAHIVFVRFDGADANDICVMNIDGSNQTRLTRGHSNDFDPVYSFDGSKIFFASGFNSVQIRRMNADGSNNVGITNSGDNFRPAVWQAVP